MRLESLAIAALHRLQPETAHLLAIRLLRVGVYPRRQAISDPLLSVRVFGRDFPNPLGLAAGFDKNAEVADPLLAQGFGHVEVGTLTPRPQAGNSRPRVFRLTEDEAVCNRYGFNNDGLESGLKRLAGRKHGTGVIGINLGINRDSTDPIADYVAAIQAAAPYGDYLTINVSSPNTPGLRDLQAADRLDALLGAVMAAARGLPPILLKISPDLGRDMVDDVVRIAIGHQVAGLIVSNTTIQRPAGLRSPNRTEAGGLSGKPLFRLSTQLLAWCRQASEGRLVLVGAGGIDGPDAAYAKIRAGASLLQVYTGLIYRGPRLVDDVLAGLVSRLRADGMTSLSAAVGIDAGLWARRGDIA